MRTLTLKDSFISGLDTALQTLTPGVTQAQRSMPGADKPLPELNTKEARHSAALMRINHTGEVCAQALYQGQALCAKTPEIKAQLLAAAQEEKDHLAWCETRLSELQSHTSVLNPAFYGLSFLIGASAGLVSNAFSLGFVAETENQVSRHLNEHLGSLSSTDTRSKSVVSQMNLDELEHRDHALAAGGTEFSPRLKTLMQFMSKVMTSTTYHV